MSRLKRSPIHNVPVRDLHKTLELFEKEHPMDYCPEFDEVKAVLEFFNKNVRPFAKINFKGGNEIYINDLENKLQNVFLNFNLMFLEDDDLKLESASMPMLRKITLFLFLNCDATYKFNLKEDSELCHVVEICPLISKFLLMTLIWDMRLDPILYEILAYMPFWFSFLHFEKAIETTKYENDPYKLLNKVQALCQAILINQTLSEQREVDAIDKKIIFKKLYDHLTNLLRQFYTPDISKIENLRGKKHNIYKGLVMKCLLEMILLQFKLIDDINNAKPIEHLQIYDVFDGFVKKLEKPPNKTSPELAEQQNVCLIALLNALQTHIFSISLEIFLDWTELMYDNGMSNLQVLNGNMAYEICERLRNTSDIKHNVSEQLSSFAIKPQTLEERIESSNIGEKLRALDEECLPTEVKQAWLDALLKDTSCYNNDECLETIKRQADIMNTSHLFSIMDCIKIKLENIQYLEHLNDSDFETINQTIELIEMESEKIIELADIVRVAASHLSVDELISILAYQMKHFDMLNEPFRTTNFDNKAIEFFNRFNDIINQEQFYRLCFEAPLAMLTRFFKAACSNQSGTIAFLKILQQIKDFSWPFCNKILASACQNAQILNELYFPCFLANLYTVHYYPQHYVEFIKVYLCDNMLKFLDEQQYDFIYPLILCCLKITSSSLASESRIFGDKTAPVLLVVAKILNTTRWDIKSFTESRSRLVNECIALIQKINERFASVATKKDRIWIMKSIANYSLSTKFYFQRYALQIDEPLVEYSKYLGLDKSEGPIPFLIQNFSRSSNKEAQILAANEILKPHLAEVMKIYGEFVEENKSDGSLNCYRHCLANFIEIVKLQVNDEMEEKETQRDGKKIEKILLKFLRILTATPKDIYEQCFLDSESLLSELLEKLEKPLTPSIEDNICKLLELQIDCPIKRIFVDKFQKICQKKKKLNN